MQETAITRARQKLREALYANRNDLAVAEVVDAIEEYVTARLAAQLRDQISELIARRDQ